MEVKERVMDPIVLQLLKLSVQKKDAIVAACDRDLRYTHLYNPHPLFRVDTSIGRRDVELAPMENVAELVALKEEVLGTGRNVQRRVRVVVGGGERTYDMTAEPIHDDAGRTVGVATAALDVTPPQDVQDLLKRLADRLCEESHGIAVRWHEELAHRPGLRPQAVFPGEELVDGVHGVVDWLARSVVDGGQMDAEHADSLNGIAMHWRRGGCSVEESLGHVDALGELLFDALAQSTAELSDQFGGVAGVEASRRLAEALQTVRVLFVATYRDAEEDRFTEFGGTLAHEIRGHLSAASSGLQLLRLAGEDTLAPGKHVEVLERTEHALSQAGQVVESVRALSRAAASGEATWSRRPLAELVGKVVADREDDGPVTVEVDEELPDVTVPAEPVQVILHNLVDNAVKYANPHVPRCWVRVHAELDPDDGHLVIHVGDNGLGVPEAERERIFLRFRRGREAAGEGFGLGLSIVREAARKFGGRILLESEPGKGSTFSLTVPASQVRD